MHVLVKSCPPKVRGCEVARLSRRPVGHGDYEIFRAGFAARCKSPFVNLELLIKVCRRFIHKPDWKTTFIYIGTVVRWLTKRVGGVELIGQHHGEQSHRTMVQYVL